MRTRLRPAPEAACTLGRRTSSRRAPPLAAASGTQPSRSGSRDAAPPFLRQRAAALAAKALTTCQSFSTSAGVGRPKSCWISKSSLRVGLSFKDQLRIAVAKVTTEPPLYPHDRVRRHLRWPPFIVGPLGFGWLPLDTKLVQRFARRTDEAVWAVEHWLTGEAGFNGTAIDAVAKTNQPVFAHEPTQRAQHLVLAAQMSELAREEHGIARLAGHPLLDLLLQCLAARHGT